MNDNSDLTEIKYPSVFDLKIEDKAWIESTLERMTLEEKCSQMIMPWVLGNYSSFDSKEFQRIKNLVENKKVGGLIFFKGDILNEAMIINQMQEISDIPLLIASDFERGLAMRLTDAAEFPYNMAIAATDDPSLAYKFGKVISAETRALGVHQNYAPVGDINNNSANPIINIRSFSEDKDIVSQFCASFIAGASEENVITTIKHFPGHGDTKIDSHKEMPLIEGDKNYLINNELVPFVQSVKAGVHSVMIGHLNVPGLEPDNIPATLSKRIITDLLKNEIGFDGLIVTDAMNMSAITNHYSVAEASVKAVQAGNDLILMPPDEEVAINSIYSAVKNGLITEERINYSVRKILAAKKWLGLNENRYTDINNLNKVIGSKSHIRLAEEIAAKSITLVKNENNLIPVDPKKIYKAACITVTDGSGNSADLEFQNAIESRFGYMSKSFLTRRSKAKEYSKALELARQADVIFLPLFIKVKAYQGTVSLSDEHLNFIDKIAALNKPIVAISFGNPYLLSLFPDVTAYLCAYGDVSFSQIAMAEAVTGEKDITGKLPVSIPGTEYNLGHGIKIERTTLKFAEGGVDTNYNFDAVDVKMIQAVENKFFPGGVLLAAKNGEVIYEKSFGRFTYEPNSTLMMNDAIFDLASLSKVIGTTTAAMILYDEGKLNIDEKVMYYLPEFGNNGKENITVRSLLLHNSGLIAYRNYPSLYKSADEVIHSIMNEGLQNPVGSKTVYSDLNMIVLQKVLEKISGKSLDKFLKERVFGPLQMHRTMYNPPVELYYYCPPTSEKSKGKKRNKGVVHDGNSFILNGVAGHAGLFSTAEDIAVFAQMMLQKGNYGGKQIIQPLTVEEWTSRQSNESSRALGWDTKSENGSSAGKYLSSRSFGHTGFTGTSIWIDPEKNLFIILLTNRVYPGSKHDEIINFRPVIHNTIIEALGK